MRILGLKYDHDSSVCLIEDGRLVFSIEAEKDSHRRHSSWNSERLAPLLRALDASSDVVAISGWWNGVTDYFGIDESTATVEQTGEFLGTPVRIFSSTHERSHILASYGMSPYAGARRPCYALTWEGAIGTFYRIGEDGRIARVTDVLDRPGHRYSFLFELADPHFPLDSSGQAYDAAGKLMALAAFGGRAGTADDRAVVELILERFGRTFTTKRDCKNIPAFNVGVESAYFKRLARVVTDALFDRFYRAAAERLTERLPLVIGGGCGLNCDWNSRWADCGLFDGVFVPPCANDSGSAIGTALDAQRALTGSAALQWSAFAGLPFSHDMDAGTKFTPRPLDIDTLAAALAAGAIVAWVQGRYEIGPRALGHRSILAAPFESATTARLNAIKQRESYRPIAPVCLEDGCHRWFRGVPSSPHMLYFYEVVDDRLRAVTHVDGSARAQTVDRGDNPELHALLTAFERLTGAAVLCNTSLNFRGRGFINRMSDLCAFVDERQLDGMVVEGVMYARNASPYAPALTSRTATSQPSWGS